MASRSFPFFWRAACLLRAAVPAAGVQATWVRALPRAVLPLLLPEGDLRWVVL